MQHIKQLLEENSLSHFQCDAEEKRIIFNYNSSFEVQKDDFNRLLKVLDENNIKYEAIGIDVILILED